MVRVTVLGFMSWRESRDGPCAGERPGKDRFAAVADEVATIGKIGKSVVLDELIRKQVLPRFPVGTATSVTRLAGGLINQTFLLADEKAAEGQGRRYVLQQVSAMFPAAIHQNIFAVTTALERAGLVTPVLLPTNDGQLCLRLPGASGAAADRGGETVWRLMTYVEGASFDVLAGTTQAHAAGALVARFHHALDSVNHTFVGLRASVHDTPRHLAHLQQSVASHRLHRLAAEVAALAGSILSAATTLPALPALSPRVCHGDLKLNNFLFAGAQPPLRDQALCLIDLDTVGPMPLAFELGDAWRSWCNRNGENQEVAALDLELFEASLDGYQAGLARTLTRDERRALLLGPEWISLELSARFAADALTESYFGWDPAHFAGRGEHNLVRAQGQFSMFQALQNTRPQRATLLTRA
jgi:Ser/Thr protein kinase RdoA (MazF antagonist)